MDKKVNIHVYIYTHTHTHTHTHTLEHYSAIKQMWIEIDEPRASYIDWSKSERVKQILYINSSIWNLEKIVLINSFVKKEWRCRCREWTCGHTRGRRKVKVKVTQSCPTLRDPMEDSPGQNTEVGCCSLLQGIFPTQGLSPGLPHCRQILYHLCHQGSQQYRILKIMFTWQAILLFFWKKYNLVLLGLVT